MVWPIGTWQGSSFYIGLHWLLCRVWLGGILETLTEFTKKKKAMLSVKHIKHICDTEQVKSAVPGPASVSAGPHNQAGGRLALQQHWPAVSGFLGGEMWTEETGQGEGLRRTRWGVEPAVASTTRPCTSCHARQSNTRLIQPALAKWPTQTQVAPLWGLELYVG